MRVLVTGGSGFLGAWVVRQLAAAGVTPVVFDMSGARDKVAQVAGAELARDLVWVVGDIRRSDEVMLAAEGCKGVIHLAGMLTPECSADPVLGAEVNLIGTLNVFDMARRSGIGHVAYASSAGVYGPESSTMPQPATFYGAYKLACEGAARAYWRDYGISSIGLRPFVVYGPGREGGLSAGPTLACRAAALGEAYRHPFTGSCGLVYVEDVAAVFVQAALQATPGAQVFNMGGEDVAVAALLDAIRQQVPGASLSAQGPALPIAAGQGAAGLDDWFPGRPRTGLVAGLAQTIAYYRAAAAVPAANPEQPA